MPLGLCVNFKASHVTSGILHAGEEWLTVSSGTAEELLASKSFSELRGKRAQQYQAPCLTIAVRCQKGSCHQTMDSKGIFYLSKLRSSPSTNPPTPTAPGDQFLPFSQMSVFSRACGTQGLHPQRNGAPIKKKTFHPPVPLRTRVFPENIWKPKERRGLFRLTNTRSGGSSQRVNNLPRKVTSQPPNLSPSPIAFHSPGFLLVRPAASHGLGPHITTLRRQP